MRFGFPLLTATFLAVLSACAAAPDDRTADPAPNADVPPLEGDVELRRDDDPDSPRTTCGRWCTDRLFACEDGCAVLGDKFISGCAQECDNRWGICQRQCKILFPF